MPNNTENNKPTHYFWCRHCIGGSCKEYTMKCQLIKITKNGMAKILLFGERNWKSQADKRSIRYIDVERLIKI